MERGSDKHGRRLDEALEKETRGIVQAGRETRAQEWNSSEPSGEDQPDVDRSPDGTLTGGLPDGLTEADVEGRSELASVLGKEIWPADRDAIRARAAEENAPDRIIDLVDRLPARSYQNVADVWQALTGTGVEQRF